MKKQILNIGNALNKAEQKTINGGKLPPFGCVDSNNPCNGNHECRRGEGCFIQSDDLPLVAVCKCLN